MICRYLCYLANMWVNNADHKPKKSPAELLHAVDALQGRNPVLHAVDAVRGRNPVLVKTIFHPG